MREGRREAALASSGTRCLAGVRMSGTTFRPEPQSRPAGPAPSPWGERVGVRGDSRAPSKAAGAQRRLEGGTISRSVRLPRLRGAAPPTPLSRRSVRTVVSWTRGIPRRAARGPPTRPRIFFLWGRSPHAPARIARRPPRGRPAPSPWGEGRGEGRSLSCGGPCGVSPRPLKPPSRPHAPARIARPAAARAAHGRIGTTASSSVPVAPSRSTKPYALSITGGKARLGFCIAVVASGCARPRRRIGLLGEGEARLGAVGVDAL